MPKVYPVGAGPGDLALLLSNGIQLLPLAAAVICDRPLRAALLAAPNSSARLNFAAKWQGRRERIPNDIHDGLLPNAPAACPAGQGVRARRHLRRIVNEAANIPRKEAVHVAH